MRIAIDFEGNMLQEERMSKNERILNAKKTPVPKSNPLNHVSCTLAQRFDGAILNVHYRNVWINARLERVRRMTNKGGR